MRYAGLVTILVMALSFVTAASATIDLRYSTASQEIPIGIVVDSTNGNDEETGLTLAAADIHIWKAGGTRTYHGNSAATHMNNGIYYYVADANDTNTKGPLVLFNHTTGALPERVDCRVLDPNEWDRMYSIGEIDVYSVGGTKAVATNLVKVFSTDFAALYDDANDCWMATLENISDAAGLPTTSESTMEGAVQGGLTAQGYTSTLATNLGTTNTNVTDILADTSALDTASELHVLLVGKDVELAGEPNQTAILTDTAAMDTASELRTLLTGGTNALVTTANLPTNFAALDINASGQVDIYQIENVDATTQLGTVTIDAADLLNALRSGYNASGSVGEAINQIMSIR